MRFSSVEIFPNRSVPVLRNTVMLLANCGLLYCLLFMGCAQIVQPTGGPKDLDPPELDTLLSTRNYQTRFEKQEIVLAFDEWVELRDAFSQVIVSPPLEFRPEVVRKKKTILFSFHEDEILRDSATYVINFGNAIQDITEGNVAPISFVFSTGDFIDSLSVSGQVVDAFTNEPVKDVLFLLYENLADSVFKKERPFYFARSNEEGNFRVRNMKSGVFKATALVDGNLNYLFDSEAEKVGFLDEPIVVKGTEQAVDSFLPDSLNVPSDSFQIDSLRADAIRPIKEQPDEIEPRVSLRLFQPLQRLFVLDNDSEKYGLVKLVFNREPFAEAEITFDDIGQTSILEPDKDTLKLWYTVPVEQPWNVYVKIDTLVDTIAVETGKQEDFYQEDTLRVFGQVPRNLPVQAPSEPFGISFNHPLSTFDSTRIFLYEDSLKIPVRPHLSIDSTGARQLFFDFDWKPDLKYEAEIWPGSLVDIYGLSLPDTVRRSLVAGAPDEYSTLTLRVKKLKPDTAYVIRLLEQNENEYRSFRVADSSQFEVQLFFLPPGNYSVELIEDLDQNGRWTTGNYDLGRQPERIRRRTLEELRANWEVESEIEWTDKLLPSDLPGGSSPERGESPGVPGTSPRRESTLPSGIRPGSGRGNR